MGLAASQAKLLMLTSRKSDVEGKLMQLANEKLALARNSADLSKEYTASLNVKKMTWMGNSGEKPLTYDLLMRPNLENNAGQYIVTNPINGRVILDSRYINNIGLTEFGNAGALADSMNKEMFLIRLIGCSPAQAASYAAGSTPATMPTDSFTTNYDNTSVISGLMGLYASSAMTAPGSTASDIISNFQGIAQNTTISLGNALKGSLLPSLGSGFNSRIDEALNYAYLATFNKFVANITSTDSTVPVVVSGNPALSSGGSAGTNRLTSGGKFDGGQLINTILSYFDLYSAQHFGGTSGSSVGGGSTTRATTGGTGTATASTAAGGSTADIYTTMDVNNNDISDLYEAHFYLNLYDIINASGWQANAKANDKDYLQNRILSGNISIKQMQTDGSWLTTSTNDYDCPLNTQSDTEAITKTEGAYEAAKDLLDNKEKRIDLTMERLDTEHSAIITEVDSIQAVIKKNIERSFKIFDA